MHPSPKENPASFPREEGGTEAWTLPRSRESGTRRLGCRGSARLQGSGRVGSSGWHCQQPETSTGTERPQEHGAGTLQPFLLRQGGWWALTGDPGGVGLPGKSLTAGRPWKEPGIIREASSVGETGSRLQHSRHRPGSQAHSRSGAGGSQVLHARPLPSGLWYSAVTAKAWSGPH